MDAGEGVAVAASEHGQLGAQEREDVAEDEVGDVAQVRWSSSGQRLVVVLVFWTHTSVNSRDQRKQR